MRGDVGLDQRIVGIDMAIGIEMDQHLDLGKGDAQLVLDRLHHLVRLGDRHLGRDIHVELGEVMGARTAGAEVVDAAQLGMAGGDIESRFSKDELLNSISLYWLTESFGSSIRFYYEAAANPWRASHANTPVVGTPTGITLFAADSGPASPDWTKEYFNRVYFKQRTTGGHFASAEEPAAIVEDIRATFRFLR